MATVIGADRDAAPAQYPSQNLRLRPWEEGNLVADVTWEVSTNTRDGGRQPLRTAVVIVSHNRALGDRIKRMVRLVDGRLVA